ncbi:hypothetical protein KQX54_012932 [Cotesia glomerata]|uniref:CCHC-type domain-containing protein n=1 Tax=Cotesia glomerata TaxID=32391 RepID=A0AAV7IH31_COTGL|nr:hypothetical protein KQX54_012932 [Cotesia glomerata]
MIGQANDNANCQKEEPKLPGCSVMAPPTTSYNNKYGVQARAKQNYYRQPYRPQSPRFPRLCHNCGLLGHFLDVCINPRQNICNNCIEIGHTRKNCPLLLKVNRSRSSQDNPSSSEQCNDPRTENERKTHLHLSRVPRPLTSTATFTVSIDTGNFNQRISWVEDDQHGYQTVARTPPWTENQPAILQHGLRVFDDPGNQENNEPVIFKEDELDPGFKVENNKTRLWSQNTGLGGWISDQHAPNNTLETSSRAAFIPRIPQSDSLSMKVNSKLAERKVFISGPGPRPPIVTAKIPMSLWIFGVTLNGILDTGSERSYINSKIHDDLKELASGELRTDETQERGVVLANHTECKSRGGAPFIIQIGSVAGKQYLSVLENLSHPIVLGMGFALQFEVIIDSKNKTWHFNGSLELHPFELVSFGERHPDSGVTTTEQDQDKDIQEDFGRESEKFKD